MSPTALPTKRRTAQPDAPQARERQAEVLSLLSQIGDDDEGLLAAESALRRIVLHRQSSVRNLSAADVSALARMGVSAAALTEFPSFETSAEGERRDRQVWRTALNANEVATLLGVSATRVRQRAADRSLYAKRHAGGWQFPAVQFPEGRELTGWPVVARAIPTAAPLVSVAHALTQQSTQLTLGGAHHSPLEWLAQGGDPEPAARVVNDSLTRLA